MAALWCAVGFAAEGPPVSLEAARAALAEGLALEDARRYADAVPKVERALALREAALGGSHPDVASCLHVLGEVLWLQGKYVRAEALMQHALAIREAALGPHHLDVAASLDLLGNLRADLGGYAQAAPLLERALAIREAAPGRGSLDVATSLRHLGRVYQLQGQYARAEPLLERALALREAALGPGHPDVAASLEDLAAVYELRGQYTRAEPLYTRALALHEVAAGGDRLLVAYSLTSLGFLHQQQGAYARAEAFYLRALAAYEAALGPRHPKVSDALWLLAQLYDTQGLYGQSSPFYERALGILDAAFAQDTSDVARQVINVEGRLEPLHERALAISEASALGKLHPRISTSLDNLAFFYNSEEARQWLRCGERGVAFYESVFGTSHPDVADLLMRLAVAYQEMGLDAQAEPRLRRALAIYEATVGANHPRVAICLHRLALMRQARGQHAQAEPLFLRALAIWEAALGGNHPDVALTLSELATTHQKQGEYALAEPLLQRALAIQEAALGGTHPDVALTLGKLASLYQDQGAYGRAAPLLLRALGIQEAALGKGHPDIALTLNRLALLHLARHRLAEALPLLARAFDISEQHLRHESLGFSEAYLASFLQHIHGDEERLYALLAAHPDDARVRRLALSAVLLRKGRSVEEIAGTSHAVYRSLGDADRERFLQLRALRSQLARLSLDGPGPVPAAEHQLRLQTLGEQADALEVSLATRSAPLRALTALPSPDTIVERVAAALPKDGALVEFIAYGDRPLVPRPGATDAPKPTDPLRYLALVLFPDGSSRAADLGLAAPIDLVASRFSRAIGSRDVNFTGPSQVLHARVFQPLVPLLGGTRRLYLAPDGQLSLVPFVALHDGTGFLVDTFDFTWLTSGKELLPRPSGLPAARSVVVLADPDFGPMPARDASRSSKRGQARRAASPELERPSTVLRAVLAEQPWTSLPGTRREAESVQRFFPDAQLFLGADATREQLLQLSAPGVLHIATHGFFLDDDARASGAVQLPPDPLMRSGLVLPEALAAPTPAGRARPRSTLLVTAKELAGLDLWGTELVVLSACDTARGAARPGQGVQGLRRAFVTAGAETVVMSLWKINDETTHQLMEDYYRHLLAGRGRSAALRDAMLALRESRPHPYYWAPFISLGSDAPLRAVSSKVPETPGDAGRP
ncbi:CHAT domain-containing tetratricopeptide repeat protein [Pyxidicoccus caerfyrddinensis]|uniref:CHAT domain-containing tetratricopeptide repeat protein n=1 Tax=Pyxidicoccus caerfyrddinensis TaxID=2709663 RepID=UPI0013DC078D|nr:CHAT domain-containing tetratricopeptide repeat protein [Pyxidicoccus caerfyrddinensis]